MLSRFDEIVHDRPLSMRSPQCQVFESVLRVGKSLIGLLAIHIQPQPNWQRCWIPYLFGGKLV